MDEVAVARLALVRNVAQGDLVRAAVAVAREDDPAADEELVLRQLGLLADRVRDGLAATAGPAERLLRLHAVLFSELGFRGNTEDYEDPRNSWLHEVLASRTGLPITLAIVYVEVARRCGFDAAGVGFPGHFLCKVQLDGGETVVDPFLGGRVLDRAELRRRLTAAAGPGRPLDASVLRAATAREILVRMLHNLRNAWVKRGDLPRALSAVDRILLLAPGDVGALRERAKLCEGLGGTRAAAADLERALELDPAAADAGMLREKIARLKAHRAVLN